MAPASPVDVVLRSVMDVGKRLDRAKASPRINEIESIIAACPQSVYPVQHHFIPGFYIREILMTFPNAIVSKIHKTRHAFYVAKGRVLVYDDDKGVQDIQAPFWGITEPGTRRVLKIVEDCVWLTFHATDKTDLKELEAELIEPHDFAHLPEMEAEVIAHLAQRSLGTELPSLEAAVPKVEIGGDS